MNEEKKKKFKRAKPIYDKAFRERVLYQLTVNGGNVGRTTATMDVGCQTIEQWRDEGEGQKYIKQVEEELKTRLHLVSTQAQEVSLKLLATLSAKLDDKWWVDKQNVMGLAGAFNSIMINVLEIKKLAGGYQSLDNKIAQAIDPAAWLEIKNNDKDTDTN